MDIFNLLKDMNPETLQKSIAQATAFLSTPEGQNAAQMLSQGKMPDGSNMPDELKKLAEGVKDNKKAQECLGEYLKKKASPR